MRLFCVVSTRCHLVRRAATLPTSRLAFHSRTPMAAAFTMGTTQRRSARLSSTLHTDVSQTLQAKKDPSLRKRHSTTLAGEGAGPSDEPTPLPATSSQALGSSKATRRSTKRSRHSETGNSSHVEGVQPEPKKSTKRARRAAQPDAASSPQPPPPLPEVALRDFRSEGPAYLADDREGGFRGRLGYACLNTVLRSQKPAVFCSRTARIKTIEEKGIQWVQELFRQNVRDIVPMLEWNKNNGIHFMRLSSEMFPFASHAKYGYDVACASAELRAAGEAARALRQRLTFHPGQFCQLGTLDEKVLAATQRELLVHAKVLDHMGLDQESVMIVHGGGTYGDRAATLERIAHTISHVLPDEVRRRLVLENDEVGFSAEELLPVCESLDVPLVYDFHHGALRPSSMDEAELMPRILAIWRRRGIRPKFHHSEPRPGAATHRDRRAHSDRISRLPYHLPNDVDVMLECKDKEQGVLQLHRAYGLAPVRAESVRAPADVATQAAAKGRKARLDGSGGTSTSKGPAAESKGKRGASTEDKARRAILHTMQLAERRGVEYKGPKLPAGEDETEAMRASSSMGKGGDAGPPASTAQVLDDMRQRMALIEAELRAGRPRPSYDDVGGSEEIKGEN